MARYSLRGKVREMEVNDTIKVPQDYEGITIRNYASCIGRDLGRRFSVKKDAKTSTYIIRRIS